MTERPKRIRIRFFGGPWDGYKIVSHPLPLQLRAPVRPSRSIVGGAQPDPYAPLQIATYELDRFVDETGIPMRAYRLSSPPPP